MHFNVKHIFQGDPEQEIKDKINYNFDQILSFAIGPDGHPGPKGSLGLPGPGGYKGATGETGLRPTFWYKQNAQPSSPNPFDLWVDTTTSDYQVYSRTTTNSWSYTGYSLFNSLYFQSYSGIVGPAGVTDKFAIGFKSGVGITASSTSLVISDSTLTAANSNPNRAKVLIVADSQTERPILDFSKTGAISNNSPGFYWKKTDTLSDLILRSTEGLDIVTLLGTSIDTYSASSLLFGNNASINSSGDFSIIGTSDFMFYSNTTVGSGGNFSINSSNLFLSSSIFSSQDPITISTTSLVPAVTYAFESIKDLGAVSTTSSAGLEISVNSSTDYTFEFRDLKSAPIFSGRPLGPVSSGKHSQLTFGSTGGQSGGATGGPYFYNVKRVSEVKVGANSVVAFQQTSNTLVSSTSTLLLNVFDITDPNIWNSDNIVLTPTSYLFQPPTNGYQAIWIRVPSSISSTLDGVYYLGTSNKYRIFLNDNSNAPLPRYIYGLVFTYFNKSRGGVITQQLRFINFESGFATLNSQCQYIDIFYAPVANLNNGNPRLFWKTCNGMSGYISLTNNANIGTVVTVGSNIQNLGNQQNQTTQTFG